jgi:hypothetical protein
MQKPWSSSSGQVVGITLVKTVRVYETDVKFCQSSTQAYGADFAHCVIPRIKEPFPVITRGSLYRGLPAYIQSSTASPTTLRPSDLFVGYK